MKVQDVDAFPPPRHVNYQPISDGWEYLLCVGITIAKLRSRLSVTDV